MSGNTLSDLNSHLFSQLDRLSDATLTAEQLANEINRAKAITDVSKEVVSAASLQLDAIKLKADYKGLQTSDIPALLGGESRG